MEFQMDKAIADKKSFEFRKEILKGILKSYEWDEDMEMPFNVGEEGDVVCYKNFHFYIQKKYKKTMTIRYLTELEYFKNKIANHCRVDIKQKGVTFPQEHYDEHIRQLKFSLRCWQSASPYHRSNPKSQGGVANLKTKKVKLF
jgi:hypothetical protein